jgi:Flp pilus assembly protein TadD
LQIDTRAIVAANNLAWLLAERGDSLDYALVLARDAVTVTKDDPVVLDTLAWVYLKKAQPAQAIPELQKAIKLAPGNPVYHYHLGLAYAAAKDPVKARAALQHALQLNPNFPGAAEARERLRTLID